MRYAIWNKTDKVYTLGIDPKHGRIDYTPEEWIARYGWCEIPGEYCVLAAGAINGAICIPLSKMVSDAERMGCDFTGCETPEDKLAAIEAFEDAREAEAAAAAAKAESDALNAEITASSLTSIAASMEYQNMMTLPDEEEGTV